MWSAEAHRLVWHGEWNVFSFSIFSPDYSTFSWEVFSLPFTLQSSRGYDDWVQKYPRDDEISAIKSILDSLDMHPRRIHIAGISCIESVDLIRSYYASLWYEDSLAKNYILPSEALLTVSLSLRHILWCEKDKGFLRWKDTLDCPYYALVPPLRSPRDLRALQQSVRMGIVPCIDVGPDESFLVDVLERQILTPFQMVRSISRGWSHHGFLWHTKVHHFSLPDFSDFQGEWELT